MPGPLFWSAASNLYLLAGGVAVFPAGETVGVALTSDFFSSFFSPLAGLAAGEVVADGLETVTGAVADGDAAGAVVFGALFVELGSQAPAKAVRAARTVSRISLLIVFSFVDHEYRRSFRAAAIRFAAPAKLASQPDAANGRSAMFRRAGRDRKCVSLQHCDEKNAISRETCRFFLFLDPILCARARYRS